MRHPATEKLKRMVRPPFYRLLYRTRASFECPICGYRGPFKDKRVTHCPGAVRRHSKCPGCNATERHRMLSLVCDEVFAEWSPTGKRLLHFAPEECLAGRLKERFGVYHTADLFMPRVDFKEDILNLSFSDGSYDCVLISHVMTSIPEMVPAVRELRRVLAPGGIAIIAEAFSAETTEEYGEQRGDFWREVGLDAVDLFGEHFARVEMMMSDRYDQKYQLVNRMEIQGQPTDQFPAAIRVDRLGYKTVVAVCHAHNNESGASSA